MVIEIKRTDWDALPEHRVRPNLRTHIRQLQGYLDRYVDDLDSNLATGNELAGASGGTWDSVSGGLLYRRRPTTPAPLQLIDDLTSRPAGRSARSTTSRRSDLGSRICHRSGAGPGRSSGRETGTVRDRQSATVTR